MKVRRSPWEPRPANRAANHTVPTSVSLPGFTPNDGGVDLRARALADRVTGKFTGTTDEIIQWASCKWGFSDDLLRAVAAQESNWNQAAEGDMTTVLGRCQIGYSVPCPESFGLTQIKARFNRGTFPLSLTSTAFNVDYALMNRRICFEGWLDWIDDPNYGAGDEWGCVGLHYSGKWMDEGAVRYIEKVKAKLDAKVWLASDF